MADMKLHYQSSGTWAGYADMNAGDPDSAGPGTMWSLAGYTQTYQTYTGTDGAHHVLSLGDGHKALFLEDSISPNGSAARLAGIDEIHGGSGGQIIDLTSWSYRYGDVKILAGSGNDILMGNTGNDTILGKAGADYLWGGSGNDSLDGGSGNDTVLGGVGNDYLAAGAGNDSLDGGTGNDTLMGGSGNDMLMAGLGKQTFVGGSGNDTLDLSRLHGTTDNDPGNHTLTFTDAATGTVYKDVLTSVETIIGTNEGNFFDGVEVRSMHFVGGTGADHFHSEGGGDTYTGGGGADVFDWMKKYEVKAAHADTVTDFQVGTDKLDLSDFLKGQTGMKHPGYADVVHLVDNAEGTMVQVLAGGTFHDAAELTGVHHVALADLLLV